MKNQSLKRSLAATAILASVISTAHGQSLVDQIGEAISGGSVNFNMRFRHESVAQDNALLDADASTVRTRLTLQSAPVSGFSGLFEVDNVSTIGSDHYDSFVMDEYRGNYSIIADPVGTEVNQAYLQYQANDTFRTRLGTQRILHAGQRFVGGVGWRQNEQTFDALTTSYFSEQVTVDYSYVWNVNRIFNSSRQSVQLTDFDSDTHFLLASHKTEAGTFSGYIYALDFSQAAALSSLTTGLSYTGDVGPATLSASFAVQSDYGNAPVDYSANYLNLELAVPIAPITATLGYEMLGSDDGVKAFTTPLATLHKWQGWTDLFLGTPANGIEDSYLTLAGNAGKLALSATFHNFSADEGGADYGSEWDLIATFPINDKISTQLKYASYDSNGYAVDTDKLWLMLNVVF
jgi:hypothetical protein